MESTYTSTKDCLALPIIASIWDLPAFAAISTTPLFVLPTPYASSSRRGRVSGNYLRRITSTFYNTMQDCVDEILRNSLNPFEPIEDILATSYASVSYVVGHEVAAPFESHFKAFMCFIGSWKSLLADPHSFDRLVQGMFDAGILTAKGGINLATRPNCQILGECSANLANC